MLIIVIAKRNKDVILLSDDLEGARVAYKERGMGQRLGFGQRPAVVIIDLIKGFTDPESPLGSNLSAVLESTVKLLNAAREVSVPVVFTTVIYEKEDAADGGVFVQKVPALKVLTRGSPWTELDPALQRAPGELTVEKRFASAFFGTSLTSFLVTRQVDTLILAGATTSGCVRATAVDGVQYGFRVLVPQECVGDRADPPHQVNLFDIDSKYGDVVRLEDVLAYLHGLGEDPHGNRR